MLTFETIFESFEHKKDLKRGLFPKLNFKTSTFYVNVT